VAWNGDVCLFATGNRECGRINMYVIVIVSDSDSDSGWLKDR